MFLYAKGGAEKTEAQDLSPCDSCPRTRGPSSGALHCVHLYIDGHGGVCFPGSSLGSYCSPLLPSAQTQKTAQAKIHSQGSTADLLPSQGFYRESADVVWKEGADGRSNQHSFLRSKSLSLNHLCTSRPDPEPDTHICSVCDERMDIVHLLLLNGETWSSES